MPEGNQQIGNGELRRAKAPDPLGVPCGWTLAPVATSKRTSSSDKVMPLPGSAGAHCRLSKKALNSQRKASDTR
eukprot:13266756-Alexandrium_andersonii.AAC.1